MQDRFPTTPRMSIACALAEIARFGRNAYQKGRAIIDAMSGQEIASADRFGDVCGEELRVWLASN